VQYDGNAFTPFTENDGLLANEIWDVKMDKEHKLWIATNSGVSVFDGKQFTTLELTKPPIKNPNVLFDKHRIVSIAIDQKGNKWFGTDGYGIIKYDGSGYEHFTTADGLSDNTISELLLDSQGNLWIGTYFGGLSVYDGKVFRNYTEEGAVCGVEVGAFYEEDNGTVWFAAEHQGVYSYKDGYFELYDEQQGLGSKGILSIFKDKEHRFWLGGWGGLFRYENGTFTSVSANGPWAP